MGKQYCILRTGGSKTLTLADSLKEAGLDAWTPVEHRTRRKPRSKEITEIVICVMPTYVFASAEDLSDLILLSKALISPHPDFSVFRANGAIPIISETELAPIRAVEARTAPKEAWPSFTHGEKVRLSQAGFEGLGGEIVTNSKGQFVLVAFPGFSTPIKVSALLLERDGVCTPDIAASEAA